MRQLLPFRDTTKLLQDILDSIAHIEMFLGGMDFPAYRTDLKTNSAVERQLQIITEAAKRLGQDAEHLCPGPDWKACRGMGDILRHAYHKVDDEIVWDTVKDKLPSMRQAILKCLARNSGVDPGLPPR